jgi:hypothetical protein
MSSQLDSIAAMTYGKWMLDATRNVKKGGEELKSPLHKNTKEYFAKKQAWTAKREAQARTQQMARA